MANQLYSGARQSFLVGQLDWTTKNLAMAACTSTFVFDEGNEFLSDTTQGSILSTVPLPNPTALNGFASADPAQFIALVDPNPITYLIVYDDTGDAFTSQMLVYFDTVAGLPATANGISFSVFPDQLFGGFFRL